MDIKQQVSAKQKAFNVIHSCETIEQCLTARKFIDNYYKLSEDGLGYNYLCSDLDDIIYEIEERMLK